MRGTQLVSAVFQPPVYPLLNVVFALNNRKRKVCFYFYDVGWIPELAIGQRYKIDVPVASQQVAVRRVAVGVPLFCRSIHAQEVESRWGSDALSARQP